MGNNIDKQKSYRYRNVILLIDERGILWLLTNSRQCSISICLKKQKTFLISFVFSLSENGVFYVNFANF